MKPALIIVDMVNEFVKGRLRSPQAEKIIPVIAKLVSRARECRVPVIHVVDRHLPFDHEFRVWGSHSLAGTWDSEIIDELKPGRDEYVFPKRFYSGFRDTGLDLALRDLGIDTLFVTGIHTHICVLHTVADAFYYGYKVFLVADGVAAFSDRDHSYALEYMKNVYGAELIDSSKAIELICGRG
ncbi:cysteine hydrolase family protein [Thermogladius sp. 4427co]|uniref:cysteine hydrolase family protein n=1 Tax=Thermogladius sp. 4427co TaxID=3450718 RepID=UPI003F78C3C6